MKIYLDNCCFNRPFDNQSQSRIKFETDSIVLILNKIIYGEIELVWSYMRDYENSFNPYPERKNAIAKWKEYSQIDVSESEDLLATAEEISLLSVSSKDSLHVACSVIAQCQFLITTDNVLIRKLKNYKQMKLINPIKFLTIIEESK